MKKLLFLFALAISTLSSWGQSKGYIVNDSTYFEKRGGNAEVIIENGTRDTIGFLYNKGGGRTIFKRGLIRIDDTTYIIGKDTLHTSRGIDSKNLGNSDLIATGNRHFSGSNIHSLNFDSLTLFTVSTPDGDAIMNSGGSIQLYAGVTASNIIIQSGNLVSEVAGQPFVIARDDNWGDSIYLRVQTAVGAADPDESGIHIYKHGLNFQGYGQGNRFNSAIFNLGVDQFGNIVETSNNQHSSVLDSVLYYGDTAYNKDIVTTWDNRNDAFSAGFARRFFQVHSDSLNGAFLVGDVDGNGTALGVTMSQKEIFIRADSGIQIGAYNNSRFTSIKTQAAQYAGGNIARLYLPATGNLTDTIATPFDIRAALAGFTGGFADPLTTNGDIIARISGTTTRKAKGSDGTYLGVRSGTLDYYAPSDAELSTSNITTNNATTSKHGFLPILPNDATKYIDGTGAWSVPSGSITGSSASGNLTLWNGTTSLTGNALFKYTLGSLNNAIGIGGTPNQNLLAGDPSHLFDIISDSSGQQLFSMHSYGEIGAGAFQNNMHFYRFGGRLGSVSNTKNGMFFKSEGYRGYDGSAITQSAGADQWVATEDWTATHHGIRYQLQVTPNGSTTRNQAFQINGDGSTYLTNQASWTPYRTTGIFNIDLSASGYGGATNNGILMQNGINNSSTIILGESTSNESYLTRRGSSTAGNSPGTSVAFANSTAVIAGPSYNQTLFLTGTPIIGHPGQTSTNAAFRLDAIGFMIGTLANVNNSAQAKFDVWDNALMGGSDDAANTRSSNTIKTFRIISPVYGNGSTFLSALSLSSNSSNNVITWGGGSLLYYSSTKQSFYTATTNTTTTGTERLRIDSAGDFYMGNMNNVYRSTNAGSDINAFTIIDQNGASSVTTAGAGAIAFPNATQSTNPVIDFLHSNGTRRIVTSGIFGVAGSTTAGSETGELDFYTKPSGGGRTRAFRLNDLQNAIFGGGTTDNAAFVQIAANTTTNASMFFGGASSDVSSPTNGMVWYNSTAHALKFTDNSTTFTMAKTLTGTATLDFPSTGAGAIADLTITVTGAAVGDVVSLGVDNASLTTTGSFSAWVSATNTVTVRYSPKATEDPASGTFRASITKY